MAPVKKKADPRRNKKKGKKQMTLRPADNRTVDSEASTLMDSRLHAYLANNASGFENTAEMTTAEMTCTVVSSEDEGSSLSELEDLPVREDMPVVTGRWKKHETDALMIAINVNRDALKFHFNGPGGGKEVKRQAWRDVTAYVNDVSHTHRTVKQCNSKTSDYTQRAKEKFNKLRRRVGQTGGGAIPSNMKLKESQMKALDYLREEVVKGIPGIEPTKLSARPSEKPSQENLSLLWSFTRPTKCEYSKVKMERTGIPKSMAKKKLSRAARIKKEERRKEHRRKMLIERKTEEAEKKRLERQEERGRTENLKLQKKNNRVQKTSNRVKGKEKQTKDNSVAEAELQRTKKEKAERKRERALVRLEREERRLRRQLEEKEGSATSPEEELILRTERKRIRAEIRVVRERKKELQS